MENSSEPSLSHVENFLLKDFQKKQTPRKMTIHVLSDNKKDSSCFVELLTGEALPNDIDYKWEEDVKTKINLYSFMNFIMYDSLEDIMARIKEKCWIISNDPKSDEAIYLEVVIVLNNKNIKRQIDKIKKGIGSL